jgi:Tol biopolymer transport system component
VFFCSRMPKFWLLIALLVGATARVPAQASPPADTSRLGVEALNKAVAVAGGVDALKAALRFEAMFHGTGIAQGSGQAWSPDAMVSTTVITRRFIIDGVAGAGVREGTTSYPGPVVFHTRTVARGSYIAQVDVARWRTGTDLAVDSTGRRAHAVWLRTHSFAVLADALEHASTLGYAQEKSPFGEALHVVRYKNAAGERITLRIDAETGLLQSAEPGEFPGSRLQYDDYRRAGGVLAAHHVTVRHPAILEDLWLTSLEFRSTLPDSTFADSPGYSRPPVEQPRLTRIADGVFRADGMPGGYHTVVVDLGDSLAVLDAPQNPQWSARIGELLRAQFGAKPVGFVLVTHHHSDHVGGIAPYVARGARVVAGPQVIARFRRTLADSLRATAKFQEITQATAIGNGPNRIMAVPAPNEHALGSVAYHLPGPRILLQGDLFYIPERGPIPPAFAVTADLQRVIEAHRLDVALIVGIHGRSGSYDELRTSLQQRSEPRREGQGAGARAAAPFLNINPSWSPDGTRLVFESSRHGNVEIYVINADGTGERRLTRSGSDIANTHPSWSPDGATIVFDSNRGGAWNLYTVRPDGTGERRLTTAAGGVTENYARHPEWSPNGRLIAFDSDRDGNGEFYVIRPDGTGLSRVTESPVNESHPLWTPRGELVVVRTQDGNRSLWAVDPESRDQRRIFDDPSRYYGGLNISPNGRRFVYSSSAEGTPRLFVAPMDGSGPARPITPTGATSYEAAWSRDGTRIAFYFDRTGAHELYVVNADGTGLQQLTNDRAAPNRQR